MVFLCACGVCVRRTHDPLLEHRSISEALAQMSIAPLTKPSVHSHHVALRAPGADARSAPGVPLGSIHHPGSGLGHAGLAIILCQGRHTELLHWPGSFTDCLRHVPRSDR